MSEVYVSNRKECVHILLRFKVRSNAARRSERARRAELGLAVHADHCVRAVKCRDAGLR